MDPGTVTTVSRSSCAPLALVLGDPRALDRSAGGGGGAAAFVLRASGMLGSWWWRVAGRPHRAGKVTPNLVKVRKAVVICPGAEPRWALAARCFQDPSRPSGLAATLPQN